MFLLFIICYRAKKIGEVVYPYIFLSLSEIPLFHVLNARVTFSNLCGCDEPVSSVTVHTPEEAPEAGNHTQQILKGYSYPPETDPTECSALSK